METVRELYMRVLARRLEGLEAARARHLEGNPEGILAARRIAATLRGMGEGLLAPQVSHAGRALEEAPEDFAPAFLDRALGVLQETLATAPRRPEGILLVEGEFATAGRLASQLSWGGRETFIASTPAQATAILAREQVSLIVLDVPTVDLERRDLIVRLRTWPRTARIPLLLLCAPGTAASLAERYDLWSDQCFEKPVDGEALEAAVAERLDLAAERGLKLRVDSSTGLLNRAALCEAFEEARAAIAEAHRPITIGLLPESRVAELAVGRGFGTAREARRVVASALARSLHRPSVVARWEGDNFVVVLPDLRRADAERLLAEAEDELVATRTHAKKGGERTLPAPFNVVEVDEEESLDEAVEKALSTTERPAALLAPTNLGCPWDTTDAEVAVLGREVGRLIDSLLLGDRPRFRSSGSAE
ncbi:MAG: diguanylate cyclase [Planctomycetes bacterium]|nr:diguanylate cyclase [Planctomycetota bacterium]